MTELHKGKIISKKLAEQVAEQLACARQAEGKVICEKEAECGNWCDESSRGDCADYELVLPSIVSSSTNRTHCYRPYYQKSMTHKDATIFCEETACDKSEGCHLVTIHSDLENDHVAWICRQGYGGQSGCLLGAMFC